MVLGTPHFNLRMGQEPEEFLVPSEHLCLILVTPGSSCVPFTAEQSQQKPPWPSNATCSSMSMLRLWGMGLPLLLLAGPTFYHMRALSVRAPSACEVLSYMCETWEVPHRCFCVVLRSSLEIAYIFHVLGSVLQGPCLASFSWRLYWASA